jgi:ATP-dependent Clp protease, protease subunit
MMAKTEKDKELRSLDDRIDALLLDNRRLFFSDVVDNNTARDAIRKLWYLELTEPGKPIIFIINSPGGSVDAGFAVWDQVQLLTSPIHTLVTGLAASMGSVLSLCAAPGKRFATPFARIMIHQPSISGVVTGPATDLSIQAEQILKLKSMLVELYMKFTTKDQASVEKALDRDTWMDAKEALEFGLIDKIVTNFKEVA